jgi:hypothetical protein
MKFYGKLKRRSFIYNNFCEYLRASGMIDGVLYRRVGQEYVSDLLTQGQINSIRARQDGAIELIATTVVALDDEKASASDTPDKSDEAPVIRRRRPARRRLPEF